MNPAWLFDYPEFKHGDYMRVCFAMQKCCKATYFLPDWKESEGAVKEYNHAKKLGHAIFFNLKHILKKERVEFSPKKEKLNKK